MPAVKQQYGGWRLFVPRSVYLIRAGEGAGHRRENDKLDVQDSDGRAQAGHSA